MHAKLIAENTKGEKYEVLWAHKLQNSQSAKP